MTEAPILVFFFFSSRGRHTRLVSDWNSDVCSSDLCELAARRRAGLKLSAKYRLNPDGTHERLLDGPPAAGHESVEALGRQLESRIHAVLGHSLQDRKSVV